VHTASGTGMEISHLGSIVFHIHGSNLHLKNIFHVPKASKSLISVNRLARDNNAFLEFHPNHFLIKEQGTKRTLLQGSCEGGLYPLKSVKSV
jgi:histone deacetylase 1/2